jgi:hypothetical protein
MMWLPEHGVGAVILTNADSGVILRGLLQREAPRGALRREAEAEETLKGAVARRRAAIAKERERLVVPADPEAVAKLAKRYNCKELGEVKVAKDGKTTVFDAGEWKIAVASRKNDDGSISFITIDPAAAGFEFVVADKDGKRQLVTRDAQHEYLFVE